MFGFLFLIHARKHWETEFKFKGCLVNMESEKWKSCGLKRWYFHQTAVWWVIPLHWRVMFANLIIYLYSLVKLPFFFWMPFFPQKHIHSHPTFFFGIPWTVYYLNLLSPCFPILFNHTFLPISRTFFQLTCWSLRSILGPLLLHQPCWHFQGL